MTHHHDPLSHHKKAYVRVWIALLILTVVTVWVAYHDYGAMNIVVAMFVASVKAALVMLIFMHLKYDNRLNQVVFASAFVFLAILVGLTMSDVVTRELGVQAPVSTIPSPAGGDAAQMKLLMQPTPELIETGKQVYAIQCATCHGAAGLGDGPAAAALKPPPRNFTAPMSDWKNGGTPAQIYKTLQEGIPGTSMASYASLPLKEHWALVHYIHASLMKDAPADTPATIAATGIAVDDSAVPQKPQVKLPIDFAIDRMVQAQ